MGVSAGAATQTSLAASPARSRRGVKGEEGPQSRTRPERFFVLVGRGGRRGRTETERGPLTSQRGRLVFHLDAVSSTVRAERSSRGSRRQAGR